MIDGSNEKMKGVVSITLIIIGILLILFASMNSIYSALDEQEKPITLHRQEMYFVGIFGLILIGIGLFISFIRLVKWFIKEGINLKKILIGEIATVLLLVVSLSGCIQQGTQTENSEKYGMEIEVINNFSDDIEGFIEIKCYEDITPHSDQIVYEVSRRISVNNSETKSYWFEMPRDLKVGSSIPIITVMHESGISDSCGSERVCGGNTGWTSFTIYGTPPTINVEYTPIEH